jgi:hypothetical protein
MSPLERKAWGAALGIVFGVWLGGCGTPGAPQPPSLNLAVPIADLAAARTGDRVALTWTMPKRNTDRTLIKGNLTVNICRREGHGPCSSALPSQVSAAGMAGQYIDTLPASLASGTPRPITYLVELQNRNGRSAGFSNAAIILAGKAPARIEGLQAEVVKEGVVLSWNPDGESTTVRLDRRSLTPPPKSQEGPLAPAPEASNQTFLVAPDPHSRAIDRSVRFGESYQYRAQRVLQAVVDGKTLELDGAFSDTKDVEVQDVFPPSVPSGLVAVAALGENGSAPAIDLSWQPDTDVDLAGYIVYRRKEGGAWERIPSGGQVVAPAFHDTQVLPGHTYLYAVSAIDKGGHESKRSPEVQETVPQP